jgi:hypothetical protein
MRTFALFEDDLTVYELRYQVRLLRDVQIFPNLPGDPISYHAGEVIIMNADDTITALCCGYGEYVMDIINDEVGMGALSPGFVEAEPPS